MSAVLYKSKQRNVRRQVQCQHSGKPLKEKQDYIPPPKPLFTTTKGIDEPVIMLHGRSVSCGKKSNVRKYRHKDNVVLYPRKKKTNY